MAFQRCGAAIRMDPSRSDRAWPVEVWSCFRCIHRAPSVRGNTCGQLSTEVMEPDGARAAIADPETDPPDKRDSQSGVAQWVFMMFIIARPWLPCMFNFDAMGTKKNWVHALLTFYAMAMGVCIQAQPINVGDCDSAAFVCSDTLIQGTSISAGAVDDLQNNFGCLFSGERAGAWIRFSIATGGLLGLTLTPDFGTTDLDMVLWGPASTFVCPPQTDPVRCSFASRIAQPSSSIGLMASALDTSEVANGDGMLALLPVNAGDVYTLFVDDFSMSGGGIAINWLLLQGASLSCAQPIGTTIPGILALSDAQVRVLPDVIEVSVPQGELRASLIDALGREVAGRLGNGQVALPSNTLAPGRYTVLIKQAGGEIGQRISVVIM